MRLNYLDAFSGIGGFHRGLEEAGFRFNWVGFSEINRGAKQIYKGHFPYSEDLGDVKTIISRNRLPGRLDLFTFGFPCQDLSVAGKRRGLHAERSGLFFEALEIIKVTRPTVFIFENVKGLFSSGDWRDFKTLLRAVADLGLYVCEWQLLNTRWLLPQNRERVYFIGHLRGKSSPKVFPFTEGDQDLSQLQRLLQGQIQAQGRRRDGGHSDEQLRGEDGDIHKIRVIDAYNKRETDIPGTIRPNSSSGACVQVIIEHDEDDYTGIRRLTPLECERLQGFPDGWTEGLSDTQRYKCLGNAVSVPVVRAIGERLKIGWF